MRAVVPESDGAYVMRLTGSWTIERAGELKQVLLECLSDGHDVTVDLGEVVEVDLSFLQLLCSAHRTFLGQNKHFLVHANRPEALKEFVKNAGFAGALGCHQTGSESCLWIGGWES